jgi:hypothetical protein
VVVAKLSRGGGGGGCGGGSMGGGKKVEVDCEARVVGLI